MAAYKDEVRNTWYVKFYCTDYQGNRKPKLKRGFTTKREALEWERNYLQQKQGDVGMTFCSFVEVYRKDKDKRIKASTWDSKNRVLEQKLIPWFGNMTLNEIKPSDILNWQNAMIEQGLSASYLRMIQNQLTAVFNHAERFYNLKENPCKKVDKMGSAKPPNLNFWTQEEFDKFISQIKDKPIYAMIFKVLFWTGMRIGEVLALTKEDIIFSNCSIRINKTYYRKNKKDYVTTPKTEKSNRVTSVPRFLMKELKLYMSGLYGLEEADRIFSLTQRPVQHWLVAKAKEADIKQIRVHDLRHSHVALLIRRGVAPIAIAQRIGHESVTTTMNTYGHLYPTVQGEIAEMLNKEALGVGDEN